MAQDALPSSYGPVTHPTSGERGLSVAWQRRLFILPAVLLTFAIVIFPTVFGLYVAFTDWQLNDVRGREFNGIDNFVNIASDSRFWNALRNNFVFLGIGVPLQYVIALGLALLVNQDIVGRRFFRVVFLLPFMMSPVAVGWMVGRSMFDAQRGPIPAILNDLGFENATFFSTGTQALTTLIVIDAWYSIPFIFVMLLAGLQALPGDVFEASKVDGANWFQTFWSMTFPLLLPVSLTAIVIRMIFEFKIIDIIQVVTDGGPGNATETMTSYIYRRGLNPGLDVGYGTAMAVVFLIVIILTITLVLNTIGRRVQQIQE